METNNYDFLYCIPEGWESLAREMIQKCEAIDPAYTITTMKEKYGVLRVYSKCSPEFYTIIDAIESHYEELSANVCCTCGKPATKYSTGWILPWCDECGKEDDSFYERRKLFS